MVFNGKDERVGTCSEGEVADDEQNVGKRHVGATRPSVRDLWVACRSVPTIELNAPTPREQCTTVHFRGGVPCPLVALEIGVVRRVDEVVGQRQVGATDALCTSVIRCILDVADDEPRDVWTR